MMRMHGIRIGLVVWLAAVCGAAAERAHPLPDITVYPDRDIRIEPARESAALDFSTGEFTAEELLRLQPATAGHALQHAPGIHTETRGRKYKQMYSFRGQVYPYPDVAFDGLWHREAREVPYVYPGAAIERIVIHRSSSTLLLGLADVVGVIDVRTRRPDPEAQTPPLRRAGIEAGSFGTLRGFGLYEMRGGKTAALTGAQFYRTDGRSGRNAAEELTSVFGSWTFHADRNHRIECGAYLLHGFRELEMPDPDGPALNSLKNRREVYDPLTYAHIHLGGFHRIGDEASTTWRAYVSDRQARYRQQVLNPNAPPFRNVIADEDDREIGAQIIQAMPLAPDNTLRLGLFLHRWTAPNGKQSYVGARQDVSSYALVVTDEQRIGAWTLDAGVRVARSYLHDFSSPAFDVGGAGTQTEPVRNEWEDPVISGTVGATVDLDRRQRLYLHGGLGERRPGPGAVRSDGSRPDAEQRFTAEGGWATAWGARDAGRVKAGGFWVARRNAITRTDETGVDARGQEFYFSGNQDLRQAGIEVELETPRFWENRLSLSTGLTWMTSEVRTHGRYQSFREVPSVIASLGLRADVGRWDGGVFARHVSAYENRRFSQGGVVRDLGDYVGVSLTAGVRPGRTRNLRLYAAVDNLLDDRYSTVVGWSDPGIRIRAGAEAEF